MKTLSRIILSLMITSLTAVVGCGDDTGDGIACTTEARSSVTVKVVDATGAAVSDATVTYSVGGDAPQNCELFPGGTDYVCGYEIAGEFTITVTKGADTKTQTVTVGKTTDGCHVEGQTITVTLGV